MINNLSSHEEQYNTALDHETVGLIVRIKWAEYGQKSSKYFCNLEKRSNERKNIHLLRNDGDSFVSDQKYILKHLQSFYRTLYSSHSIQDQDQLTNF